ncbi:MAG: hypothetical protein FWG37_00185, partial [Clostridia bacterium]|nr:hypothetical protein [Clostridia bacterium]
MQSETITVQENTAQYRETYYGGVYNRFRKNRVAVVSFFVLSLIVLGCVFVPVFSPYRMESTGMERRELPPSGEHLLGTDRIGRDLLTRLFYGGGGPPAGVTTLLITHGLEEARELTGPGRPPTMKSIDKEAAL